MKYAVVTQPSEADYLEGERASTVRREYVAGKALAKPSGNKAHDIISLNLALLLRNALRGSRYQIFIANVRVRIVTQMSDCYTAVVVSPTCLPTWLAMPLKTCRILARKRADRQGTALGGGVSENEIRLDCEYAFAGRRHHSKSGVGLRRAERQHERCA